MLEYFDAHLHLQDKRLAKWLPVVLDQLGEAGVRQVVVNGTCEEDWSKVSELADHPIVRPAFGLHPWFVRDRSPDWFERLQTCFDQHPNALMGEIGLDKWIRNSDFPDQVAVFEQQLELSQVRMVAPTIHCLRAWGTLKGILDSYDLVHGFLLHSFSGPSELVKEFLEMGAFFSFSGYFTRADKVEKCKKWKQIPLARILVETDAPDMLPPVSVRVNHPISFGDQPINHPLNLVNVYRWLANYLNIDEGRLVQDVACNYRRLFGEVFW